MGKRKFSEGQRLYTKFGKVVAFERQFDDVIYARPFITVVYEGDYGRDECEEVSDAIISYSASDLFTAPPIDVVNQEIKARREGLKEFKSNAATEIAEIKKQLSAAKSELSRAQSDLERWNVEHRQFIDLGRLLNGDPMFPLHAPKSVYHRGYDVPSVPKWDNCEYLAVTPNVHDKKENWQIRRARDPRTGWTLQFFYSEEDRNDFISDLFDKTCDKFRENPNFSTEGKTYSTRLDFGRLGVWVDRFPFLTVPEDITSSYEEHLEAQKEAKRARLKEELDAMGPAQ